MIDEIDLSGMYDLHIHTAPDVSDRCLDDLEAAEQAEDAGMAGILLKSHHTLTADRAVIAAKGVSKLKVYGSLTLNDAVGGLNIAAVETALKMGAREIFMPTISAANHRGRRGRKTGIDLLDCAFVDPLREILSLVKDYNAILGTGHISKEETRFLVQMALGQGLKKIVVTHPELPLVNMSSAEQAGLKENGVFFERCFASTMPQLGNIPVEQIVSEIREVGASCTFLTTDLGVSGYPVPVEGMRRFVELLQRLGVGIDDMDLMLKENPALLLEP